MQEAYIRLHEAGHAMSIEVFRDDSLCGGLYGVVCGSVFCGESMFSLEPNTSKLALIHLCRNFNFDLIDCQVHTDHLERMGAERIDASSYRKYLSSSSNRSEET
jgi:leucyl/phenylalanyl-tRNA--protein transferase